jgi:hypothetical protein
MMHFILKILPLKVYCIFHYFKINFELHLVKIKASIVNQVHLITHYGTWNADMDVV